MKKSLLFLLSFLTASILFAQGYEVTGLKKDQSASTLSPSKNVSTVKPLGLRMRNIGRGLTIASAVPLITGIALASTADELYYSSGTGPYGTYEEGDPQGALGVVLITMGTGMLVTGGILWSKGQKKYNRYKRDHSVSIQPALNKLTLSYRF